MELISSKVLELLVMEQKKKMESILPDLIKRLILNACPKLSHLRIPGSDDIWAPGFDGVIFNEEAFRYVDSGQSVWEFGTNSDSLAKINADYQKRTDDPLGINKKEATFYLVVPKIWAYATTITEWEATHKDDWKAVYIYDASILCDWMNSQPAVTAWFLENLYEEKSLDFSSVSHAWNKLSHRTNPTFTHKIFTIGREEQTQLFLQQIKDRKICRVKAETMVDASGFCLSSLLTDKTAAETATVIYNENTYYHLSKMVEGKILLALFPFSGQVSDRNITILCFSREASSTSDTITLPSLLKSQFLAAIEDMGISTNGAHDLYSFTHGQLLSLIRKIPGNDVAIKPQWAYVAEVDLLRPLVFLQHYQISNQGDQQVVSRLAGTDYSTIERKYQELLRLEDAPIKRVEGEYILVNYEEAWMALNIDINDVASQNLYKEILFRLSSICQANYQERTSISLRQLIYNYLMFSQTGSDSNILREQIEKILEYFQTSIGRDLLLDHLPILAQAAPNVVYTAIEDAVKSEYVRKVFSESNFWAKEFNLLHTLSRLTMIKETSILACKLLFNLCRLAKEDAQSNRARESLLNALCLWYPHSALLLEHKKQLIQHFAHVDAMFCIPFIIDLLTKKQFYRSVLPGEKEPVTNPLDPHELQKAYDDLATIAFDTAIQQHRLDWINSLLQPHIMISHDVIISAAEKFNAKDYTPDQLLPLQFELRVSVFNMMHFKSNIPKEWIDSFNTWITHLKTDDALGDIRWMFFKYYPAPFSELLSIPIHNFDQQEATVREVRGNTFLNTKKELGFAYALQLIDGMSDDSVWGLFLSNNVESEEYPVICKEIAQTQKYRLLAGLLNYYENIELATDVFRTLPSEVQEKVLPHISRSDTEHWLTTPKMEQLFWQSRTMVSYDEHFYHHSLKYNPCGLLPFLYREISNHSSYFHRVVEVFQAIVDSHARPDSTMIHIIPLIIEEVDKHFYSDQWAEICLQLYNDGLSSNFYVPYPSCLQIYFFRNPSKIYTMFLEDMDNFIQHFPCDYRLPAEAFRDYGQFKGWCDFLYKNSTESTYLLHYLGGILARSVDGADGIFPHEFVRDILEEYHDDNLIEEIVCGKINTSGVRTVMDGVDEQRVADAYRKCAQPLEIVYPETAKILKSLAEYYEGLAKSDRLYAEIGRF